MHMPSFHANKLFILVKGEAHEIHAREVDSVVLNAPYHSADLIAWRDPV